MAPVGLDIDAFLKSLVDLQTSLSKSADTAKQGADLAEAMKDTSFIQSLYEQCQDSYGKFMDAVNADPVLSGAKNVSGQVLTTVTSPAVQIAGSMVLGGFGGPIGLGIAAGAAAAQVAAGASFINGTRVMHDEAIHLAEYAGYREQKDKVTEDIYLKCKLRRPETTREEVESYLKGIGVTNIGEQASIEGKRSRTLSEEELSDKFKSDMATNFTLNAFISVAARPAVLATISSPIGAASFAANVGHLMFSSYFQTAGQMTEAIAQEKVTHYIEELRESGPKYRTHDDIDKGSVEYSINSSVKAIKEKMGYQDDSDPGKRAISRKYDLAEAALRERISTEALLNLSRDETFIGELTEGIASKRTVEVQDQVERVVRESYNETQQRYDAHTQIRVLNEQIVARKDELSNIDLQLGGLGSDEHRDKLLAAHRKKIIGGQKEVEILTDSVTADISPEEHITILDRIKEHSDQILVAKEEIARIEDLLEKESIIRKDITHLESEVAQHQKQIDLVRKHDPYQQRADDFQTQTMIRNFDEVGDRFDAAKQTETYGSEQLETSSMAKSVRSATSAALRYLDPSKKQVSMVSTYSDIMTHAEKTKAELDSQNQKIDASIAKSQEGIARAEQIRHGQRQKKMVELSEMIARGDSFETLSKQIQTLDKETMQTTFKVGDREMSIIEFASSKKVESELHVLLVKQGEFTSVQIDSVKRIEKQAEVDSLAAMVSKGGDPSLITKKFLELDEDALSLNVKFKFNGKEREISILELAANSGISKETFEAIKATREFGADEVKKCNFLFNDNQNKREKAALDQKQQGQIEKLASLISGNDKDKNKKAILDHIQAMDKDALARPVNGKSVIELISEKNAGTTIMKAVLSKGKFSKDQMTNAIKNLKTHKAKGMFDFKTGSRVRSSRLALEAHSKLDAIASKAKAESQNTPLIHKKKSFLRSFMGGR